MTKQIIINKKQKKTKFVFSNLSIVCNLFLGNCILEIRDSSARHWRGVSRNDKKVRKEVI